MSRKYQVKLACYANKRYYKTQKALKQSALKNGVNKVIVYDELWLKSQKSFYERNKKILSAERGNGYWLWKPLIIHDALQKMHSDDILIYADSASRVVQNVRLLTDVLQHRDITLFYNRGFLNKEWTKRDCFFYMSCDSDKFHSGLHIAANIIVCRNTKATKELISEWLEFCQDERIISDNPNICGKDNISGFVDHRHDQSVLSILATKYALELFREPTQFGNQYKLENFRIEGEIGEGGYCVPFHNSPYPTIFDAHRKVIPLNIKDRLFYRLYSLQMRLKSSVKSGQY